jgi:AraC-like DNA-binding protein
MYIDTAKPKNKTLLKKKFEAGFSDIGGIYTGAISHTKSHVHHAVTVAVSEEDFEVTINGNTLRCRGIAIQPHTVREFKAFGEAAVAFIHIEPFSMEGFSLTDRSRSYQILLPEKISRIYVLLHTWHLSEKNTEAPTKKLIRQTISLLRIHSAKALDERILKAAELVRHSEIMSLKKIAESSHLSTHRFSHLFRQETGMSFKEFVLYTKLVKSLKAILKKQSFVHASYSGGFSDQAHFTRTYVKAFGIAPSKSIK